MIGGNRELEHHVVFGIVQKRSPKEVDPPPPSDGAQIVDDVIDLPRVERDPIEQAFRDVFVL